MTFNPSPYQQAIRTWFYGRKGKHLTVQAVAGSGKTRTGIWLFENMSKSERQNAVYVSFNKDISLVLQDLLKPLGSTAMTYHSLGMRSISRTYNRVKIEPDKTAILLKPMIGANDRWMIPSITKLTGLCKNLLVPDTSDAILYSLATEYDVDLFDDKSTTARGNIFHHVRWVLGKSRERTDLVDFDDMVWLPNIDDKITMIEYDDLLVDELQDTNLAQLYLALNSVSGGGSIIGIGDYRQSIYAFRGANSQAMYQFKQTLNADELPLSICYRCPTSVRDLVNQRFPDIEFQTPDGAIEGSVMKDGTQTLMEKNLKENDMVLCRINADLVPVAFGLIRKGIKATIKGKDIGRSLITLIKKQHVTEVPELFKSLELFRERQYDKFVAQDKPHKIMQLDDQIATIDVISEGAVNVYEVMTRCETIFSDARSAVTLSSIHKAKGLEAENVYILRPDLLPHPKAKKPEQQVQESNLEYVAITRPKQNLMFVN